MQRRQVAHLDAGHLAQRAGSRRVEADVVLVHHAAGRREAQHAAPGHEAFEVGRDGRIHAEQPRRDHQPVAREIVARVECVDRDVAAA